MKREKTLKVLSAGAVLCAAFAFGTLTYTANAAGETEAAANPYESLMLETGASVRYADTAAEMGFSYRLKMPKADYEAVKDNGAVYGIFLAPQDYYAEHPFNSAAEIKNYYDTENETPAAGKAKLYDYQGIMGEIDGDTENVYFRGSLLGVLDGTDGTNNLTRDFRAVGYVKYQTETESEYTYHFVQAENEADNIRSMAYVAEKAIAENILAMETASDAEKAALTAKNAKLKEYYIDKVEEPFGEAETGTLQRIYNCEDKTLTLPKVAAAEAAKANTYWKDKYEYTWQLVAGETKIDVAEGDALSDKQGIWNLVCSATKKADGSSKEVYSQPYQVTDLGATTVNGETLTTPKGDVMIKNADGTYQNEYDSLTDVVQYYPGVKAMGDFVFEGKLTVVDKAPVRVDAQNVGAVVGYIFSCGTDKEFTVFTKKADTDGRPGYSYLTFRVGTKRSGVYMRVPCFPMSTGNNLGDLNAVIQFTAKRFGNELSFYNKNGDIIFSFRADGTVVSLNGVRIEGNSAAVGAHVAAMLSSGNETVFGVYRECDITRNLKGAYKYEYNLTSKDNDGLGEGIVNGLSLSKPLGNGLLTKQEDGSYQNNYNESGEILQYVPSMRKTGDFTFNAEVTVTGNTAPERKDASNVGSGVGFVISCGTGKEIAIFSNKAQQNRLVIKTNASRNGSLIYLTGFANVNNHLGVLGAGIKFSVKRVGNTLEIYDKNGKKGVTINADGTIVAETGYGATTNATVQTYLSGMLSAGNETVFGIYREYALKGEYNWKLSCN